MKTLASLLAYLWMVTFPVAVCIIKLQQSQSEPLPFIDLAKGLIMVTFAAFVMAVIYRFIKLLQE
jgi:hypothetical protein